MVHNTGTRFILLKGAKALWLLAQVLIGAATQLNQSMGKLSLHKMIVCCMEGPNLLDAREDLPGGRMWLALTPTK